MSSINRSEGRLLLFGVIRVCETQFKKESVPTTVQNVNRDIEVSVYETAIDALNLLEALIQ